MEAQASVSVCPAVTSPHRTCQGQTPVLKQCQERPEECPSAGAPLRGLRILSCMFVLSFTKKKKRIQRHQIKDSTIDLLHIQRSAHSKTFSENTFKYE